MRIFSIMSRLALKISCSSASFLPNRLRQAVALFALASTTTSAPFAASFSVLATSSVCPHHTSVFGVLCRPSYSLSKDSKIPLSSTTTEKGQSETTTTAMSNDDDTMTPASKLDALRSKMKELDLDVYIIPSDDPHLSGKLVCMLKLE